jgi:hypothetical protein
MINMKNKEQKRGILWVSFFNIILNILTRKKTFFFSKFLL